MRPSLHTLTHTFATAAAAYLLEQIKGPVAVALVALGHALSPEMAKAEMEFRSHQKGKAHG